MQVDYLILSDAAAAAEGKHYIHGGGWDTIGVAAFPAHQSFAVAARLIVPWNETNVRQTLELDLLDEDGVSVLPQPPGPMRATMTAGRPAHLPAGDDQYLPIVLNLTQVPLARPGRYVIVLRLDGRDAARSAFRVVAIGQAQAQAAGDR